MLFLLAALTLLYTARSTAAAGAGALRTSAISASPSPSPSYQQLPRHGHSSALPPAPALSPDTMPLLPSPGPDDDGTAALAPSTIPSSPSPPNPDAALDDPDSALLAPFSAAPVAQSPAPPGPRAPPAAAMLVVTAVGLLASSAMWSA